jgi:hypothetical protein
MDSAFTRGDRKQVVAERLRTACDLWTAGVELQRQRFRRIHPGASDEVIHGLVSRWLRDRPGAERGDGPQPPMK